MERTPNADLRQPYRGVAPEMELRDVDALFGIEDPLHWSPDKSALFVRACRALASYHRDRCPELRHIYQRQGFDPASLQEENDLQRLPALNVSAFKHFDLRSKSPAQAAHQASSSGTGGQPTTVWRDQGTRGRARKMFAALVSQLGLVSRSPASSLVFAHRPAANNDLLIAYAFTRLLDFAPRADVFYAVAKMPDGNLVLRTEQALSKLKSYVQAGHPVRLLGLPAFIYEMILQLEAQGPLKLPPGSWVLTGGGWKTQEERSVSPADFRAKLAQVLGLPGENIRDRFGMAEHGIIYLQCPRHRFHIPAYARVLARDPVTLEVLPPGQTGLLEFITPLNSMMPTLAILSADLGTVDPAGCDCGLRSPTFTWLGRGGWTHYQTCALRMEDAIRREAAP